jgi:dTDP-4-amino-4,6-dideoxygalactose transaminase
LLVNYFGFRDTEYETLVQFAHSRGHIVIEDNAHGFFTYHFDRRTRVDATFFSLHKQFPFERGGILKIHKPEFLRLELIGSQILPYDMNPYVYNIEAISTKRISNFKLLSHLIESMTNTTDINPLFLDEKLDNVVPQSFPILINKADRNQIYYKLNDCGFGVVSLYHTLIDDLQRAEFNDAQSVSKRILNLPIHQDVDTDQYVSMIEELNKLCKAYE